MIKLNDGIRQELVNAGYMIQNIREGKAGTALEGIESGSHINVDAEDSFTPNCHTGRHL